jgi:hypothetical protein
MMMHRQRMTLADHPTNSPRGDIGVKALVRLQIMDRPYDSYATGTHQHEQQHPRSGPQPTDDTVGVLDDSVEEVQVKKTLAAAQQHAPEVPPRRTPIDVRVDRQLGIERIEIRALCEARWERVNMHTCILAHGRVCRFIDVTLHFGTQQGNCRLGVIATRDDDVGVFPRWGDERLMHRPHGSQVLSADRHDIAATFLGVAQDAPQ